MSADWVILHGGALGDLVLTLQLALRLPGVDHAATLHVVSRTNPGDLSACRPAIRRRSPEGLGLHRLFCDEQDAPACRLAGSPIRPAAAGRGTGPPDPALAQLVRGARVLSALGGPDSIVHRRLAALAPACLCSFDPRPRPDAARHITEQWAADLASHGLALRPLDPAGAAALRVPDSLRCAGHALLRRAAGPATADAGTGGTVLLHPGSGGPAKCWPLAGFREVGRRLRARGRPVCFVLGPVERETWPAAELAALAADFPLLSEPEPDELLAVLAAAGVLVGNDAGPAHLAGLLGTPVVVLFGPTAPALWRPLGSRVRVWAGDPAAGADWGIRAEGVVAAACDLSPRGAAGGNC